MVSIFTKFVREERGLVLSEYLVLLGILTGAVIGAVILFGDGLADTFIVWGGWLTNLLPS